MNIARHYKTLQVKETATDDEISSSYKRLAMRYHPDKNQDNKDWATEEMKNLNVAYNAVMSHRFSSRTTAADDQPDQEDVQEKKPSPPVKGRTAAPAGDEAMHREILIEKFVTIREKAKDAMYRFFQYGLYSIPKRENAYNRGIFNEIVYTLRRSYHHINGLAGKTGDEELLSHFNVFNKLIFNFYKASECINIIDSYNDRYEVDAYRMYVRGDEKLHAAHKEVFFDRHNRGYLKGGQIIPLLNQALMYFNHVINDYAHSTWVVEAQIKLAYTMSLKDYLNLFFTPDR